MLGAEALGVFERGAHVAHVFLIRIPEPVKAMAALDARCQLPFRMRGFEGGIFLI